MADFNRVRPRIREIFNSVNQVTGNIVTGSFCRKGLSLNYNGEFTERDECVLNANTQ